MTDDELQVTLPRNDPLDLAQVHDECPVTADNHRISAQVFFDLPRIDTGKQHGTVAVIVERKPVEITTFRADGRYSDNRQLYYTENNRIYRYSDNRQLYYIERNRVYRYSDNRQILYMEVILLEKWWTTSVIWL